MMNEGDIDAAYQELLRFLSPELHELQKTEPVCQSFLRMLAIYDAALAQHAGQSWATAAEQMRKEKQPTGRWRFPAQGLAACVAPPRKREPISMTTRLTVTPALGSWSPCGEGWLLPTRLAAVERIPLPNEYCLLSLDIEPNLQADEPGTVPLFAKDPGQLLFAALPETVLEKLEQSDWWWMDSTGDIRSAQFERYEGYLDFEVRLCAMRTEQHQLDTWFPFFPYSRKIFKIRCDDRPQGPDIPSISLAAPPFGRLRFAVIVPIKAETLAPYFDRVPFLLNPIPVLQSRIDKFQIGGSRLGSRMIFEKMDSGSVYAAEVRTADGRSLPTRLVRQEVQSGKKIEISVECLEDEQLVPYLYQDTQSIEARSPRELRLDDAIFELPYTLLGAYDTVLNDALDRQREYLPRSGWLTQFDLEKMALKRCSGALKNLFTEVTSTHKLTHEERAVGSRWRCHLWPSLLAFNDYFADTKQIHGAEEYLPLVQTLCLRYRKAAGADLEPFLIEDAADYLTSTLNGFFTVGSFRIEAEVI
jgi:hypothetical protein